MSLLQKMSIKTHKLRSNHFLQILQPSLINSHRILQLKENKMSFHN
jgi:hypothetical protein